MSNQIKKKYLVSLISQDIIYFSSFCLNFMFISFNLLQNGFHWLPHEEFKNVRNGNFGGV